MTETTGVGAMPVSTLVTDDVARVAPDDSLLDVARGLTDNEVGVLVIRATEVDQVLGVVSERDLVHALAVGRDPASTCAIDIAHTELSWCDSTSTVAEVAAEMMENYIRHVLVEEDGRMVGIVSARDLLGAYAATGARSRRLGRRTGP